MNYQKSITENDLLRNFESIERQLESLLKDYLNITTRGGREDFEREALPIVIEPIFSYEIHVSSGIVTSLA